MEKLINIIAIAMVLFMVISLIAITRTYGQTGRVILMKINNERIQNNLPPIAYSADKERLAEKLLDRYIAKRKVSMDKATFCEYYTFEGNKPQLEAIIDIACIGKQGWFYEEIKYAILLFRYDTISDTTLGVGLYFK
ncbi:hypothetical protein LCGC14_0503780 [marine sediment metagenome]|uniref:Uncharacterized protein n=1 Tax=marine sediment metagenome TaxID=412755 RepID=A0A0F9S385_9ZZZZ